MKNIGVLFIFKYIQFLITVYSTTISLIFYIELSFLKVITLLRHSHYPAVDNWNWFMINMNLQKYGIPETLRSQHGDVPCLIAFHCFDAMLKHSQRNSAINKWQKSLENTRIHRANKKSYGNGKKQRPHFRHSPFFELMRVQFVGKYRLQWKINGKSWTNK